MTDEGIAEVLDEVVLHLAHEDDTEQVEEWRTLTVVEFGILSWHLGNFYCGFTC